MRTLAVFLGGVVLAIAVSALLEMVFDPNAGYWVAKAFDTAPNKPEWDEISRQLARSGRISLYVVGPLAGVAVGIFVGLLQKSRVPIVTACCLVPDFLYGLLTDHAKVRAHSTVGVLRYAFHNSLPFATALAAAVLCHRFIRARHRGTTDGVRHRSTP
jgi:hypothetical protein